LIQRSLARLTHVATASQITDTRALRAKPCAELLAAGAASSISLVHALVASGRGPWKDAPLSLLRDAAKALDTYTGLVAAAAQQETSVFSNVVVGLALLGGGDESGGLQPGAAAVCTVGGSSTDSAAAAAAAAAGGGGSEDVVTLERCTALAQGWAPAPAAAAVTPAATAAEREADARRWARARGYGGAVTVMLEVRCKCSLVTNQRCYGCSHVASNTGSKHRSRSALCQVVASFSLL
jgi:hypothetical protein